MNHVRCRIKLEKTYNVYLKKIAKSIGIISKAKQFLNNTTLLQLYYSFTYPYINYGNIIWGYAPATTIWPIFKLKKIALRIITNTRRGNSTQSQSKKLRILRTPDIYIYITSLFMYKYVHHMLPPSLESLFQKNNTNHTYSTRGANNLRTPKIKTTLAEKFITFTGVQIWNSIITKIDTSLKISTFKQHLITYLTSKYND